MSSFLRHVPETRFQAKRTVKLRSTARFAVPRASRGGWDDEPVFARAPKPSWSPREGAKVRSIVQDEDYSQNLPQYIVGERVTNARFGSGTIAEVSGSGRDAKVTVDFDDETVGAIESPVE